MSDKHTPTQVRFSDEDREDIETIRRHLGEYGGLSVSMAAAVRHAVRETARRLKGHDS